MVQNKRIKNLTKNFFLILLIFNSMQSESQTKENSDNNKYNNHISMSSFDSTVKEGIHIMENKQEFSIEQAVVYCRIYNTIIINNMNKNKKNYEVFIKLFFPIYSEKSAKLLDAMPSKGMNYYSPKYNLYIGPKLVGMENSVYEIN